LYQQTNFTEDKFVDEKIKKKVRKIKEINSELEKLETLPN